MEREREDGSGGEREARVCVVCVQRSSWKANNMERERERESSIHRTHEEDDRMEGGREDGEKRKGKGISGCPETKALMIIAT